VTASGRREHPPAWGGHGPTTITTITTTSRRTRPPGRRPCSCSAPTTPSAGTPGSSSNGHILLKHLIHLNITNLYLNNARGPHLPHPSDTAGGADRVLSTDGKIAKKPFQNHRSLQRPLECVAIACSGVG